MPTQRELTMRAAGFQRVTDAHRAKESCRRRQSPRLNRAFLHFLQIVERVSMSKYAQDTAVESIDGVS